MSRRARALSLATLLSGVVLATAPAGAEGEKKPPTVKELMKRAHAGQTSLLSSVGRGLRADPPDWPAIQRQTGELVEVGAFLGRNEPPVGDRASWERLAQAYRDQVKALDEAARKEDRRGAQSAKAKLDASCGACHRAHRRVEDP